MSDTFNLILITASSVLLFWGMSTSRIENIGARAKWIERPVLFGVLLYALAAMFGAFDANFKTGGAVGTFISGVFSSIVFAYLFQMGYEIGKYMGFWGGDNNDTVGGDKETIRGQQLLSTDQVTNFVKKNYRDLGELAIGGIQIPRDLENRGILMAGSPGSGKSVSINVLLDAIRARGDRAIVVDSGGLFLKRHYKEGDSILNPFDERDAGWSPFSELRKKSDVEMMVKAFLPDQEGDGKIWSDYAQAVGCALVLKLIEQGKTTNADLFHSLAIMTASEIEDMVKGTAAARVVSGDAKGMAASALGSALAFGKAVEKLDQTGNRNSFSLRNWIRQEDSSCLFMTYDANSLEYLKGLITAQVDILCREITSLTEDRERRIWLVIDEAASLGKIGTLPYYLGNARKFGGCSIIGLQTVAQFRDAFGRETTQTILSCLGHKLVLRVADAETADMMSKMLGEAEIKLTTVSSTESENNSTTTSYQHKQERVILASELQALPDRVGVLDLAGDIPAAWVSLPIPHSKQDAAQSFELNEDEDLFNQPVKVVLAPAPAPVERQIEAVEEQEASPFPAAIVENDNPFPTASMEDDNPFASR